MKINYFNMSYIKKNKKSIIRIGVCSCGNEFKTYNDKKESCSYSCARKKVWKDPEYSKAKISALKDGWTDIRKTEWGDYQKKYQARPDVKLLRSKAQKEAQNKEGVSMKKSIKIKLSWQDPVFWKKQQNSLSYKNFILPSGKNVKLQGYEPQVLSELLKKYAEQDIAIGIKNINLVTGFIDYTYNNKLHRYFPDFYIKSTNTIIEVKSEWTYKKQEGKNKLKRQACLDKGLNFEFAIFKSGQSKNHLKYEMYTALPLFV